MKYYVYVLHSVKINKYYIGSTHDVTQRLERHHNDYYENKWTKKGKPWTLFLTIDCEDKKQAEAIERHIKRMKSKKYVENLTKYREMIEKLLERYKPDC